MRWTLASGALVLLAAILNVPALAAQDKNFKLEGQQIAGPDCLIANDIHPGDPPPCTAVQYAAWLKDITHWRLERRIRTGYSNERYRNASRSWSNPALCSRR